MTAEERRLEARKHLFALRDAVMLCSAATFPPGDMSPTEELAAATVATFELMDAGNLAIQAMVDYEGALVEARMGPR